MLCYCSVVQCLLRWQRICTCVRLDWDWTSLILWLWRPCSHTMQHTRAYNWVKPRRRGLVKRRVGERAVLSEIGSPQVEIRKTPLHCCAYINLYIPVQWNALHSLQTAVCAGAQSRIPTLLLSTYPNLPHPTSAPTPLIRKSTECHRPI